VATLSARPGRGDHTVRPAEASKVMAPPEKERANEAVMDLLSMKLGISTKDIKIDSGHSTPSKIINNNGLDDETIKKAFE